MAEGSKVEVMGAEEGRSEAREPRPLLVAGPRLILAVVLEKEDWREFVVVVCVKRASVRVTRVKKGAQGEKSHTHTGDTN